MATEQPIHPLFHCNAAAGREEFELMAMTQLGSETCYHYLYCWGPLNIPREQTSTKMFKAVRSYSFQALSISVSYNVTLQGMLSSVKIKRREEMKQLFLPPSNG